MNNGKARVKLSKYEVALGENAGIMRHNYVVNNNLKDPWMGPESTQRKRHISGALGELAVAKYFNIFWSGTVGELGKMDVGLFQVRMAYKDSHRLIMHHSDKDDDVFIFVTGQRDLFLLHGFTSGSYGKQRKYWQDPGTGRPAFFVPQKALAPISYLYEIFVLRDLDIQIDRLMEAHENTEKETWKTF